MATRTVRRDRRNTEHGYSWVDAAYPWTSTGKVVTRGTLISRVGYTLAAAIIVAIEYTTPSWFGTVLTSPWVMHR